MAETLTVKGSTTHHFPNKALFLKALYSGLLKEGDKVFVDGVEQLDPEPTEGSDNFVSSGTVYEALNKKVSKGNVAKNSDIDKLFK